MENDNNRTFKPSPSENASNPAPRKPEETEDKTLFGEKAEKYFKESAPIEDMPDAEEDQEAIDQMKKDKKD